MKMNRASRKVVTRSISQFLTSPRIVAERLDWKKNSGSLVSLFITKHKIDVALASHPEFYETIVHVQPPIPLTSHTIGCQKVVDDTVHKELKKIIQIYNVCGIIVGWPVEKEGWCGASCGRVLHTLDGIASISNSNDSILTESRPICLYDINHYTPNYEDEWGRSPIYCETLHSPQEELVLAHEKSSTEWDSETNKYNGGNNSSSRSRSSHRKNTSSSSSIAVRLMNDFCKTYWPEHDRSILSRKDVSAIIDDPFHQTTTTAVSSSSFLDDSDDDENDTNTNSFHSTHYKYTTAA